MKICVTQEDIDNGIKCSSYNCPVALAIQRHFKNKLIAVYPNTKVDNILGCYTIALDRGTVVIGDRCILLEPIANKFAVDFDNPLIAIRIDNLKPFEFELDIEIGS